MKTRVTCILLAAVVLLAASTSFAAARWDYFNMSADCDGWTFDSGFHIGSSHPFIDVTYDVTLSQGGVLVEQRTGIFRVWMTPYVVPVYEVKPWETDLTDAGVFDVAGVFVVPFTSDGDSVRTW